MKSVLLVALWSSIAMADPDAEFRAQIGALAKARHRVILSWGTLQLDGSAKPHRFAGLGAITHDQTGAYIFEGFDGEAWLVVYPEDATTFHVSEGEGPDGNATGAPPWLVLAETTIKHGLNHNHGKAYASFGFRNGKLVVLDDEDDSSRRDEPIAHQFAKNDICDKRCPVIKGTYTVMGYELMRLVGSAKTIATLPAF